PKEARSKLEKGKHLSPRARAGRMIGYVGETGKIYKVFNPKPGGVLGGAIQPVRDVDFDEGNDWELYGNPELPMPNLNPIPGLSRPSAQGVHGIRFRTKYFDQNFNLSKRSRYRDFDGDSDSDSASDFEKSGDESPSAPNTDENDQIDETRI